MKLGPITKPDKKNKTTSKRIDDDVILANFNVIVIFSIYGLFAAMRKADSRRIACKTYIFH